MAQVYYLTFRRMYVEPNLDGSPRYDEQITLFVERAPTKAYAALKRAGLRVAYGREGAKPVKDSHPAENWDEL